MSARQIDIRLAQSGGTDQAVLASPPNQAHIALLLLVLVCSLGDRRRMLDFSLIDSHVHLIDHSLLPYAWTTRLPDALRRNFFLPDLRAAIGDVAVDRVIFVEFLVDAD